MSLYDVVRRHLRHKDLDELKEILSESDAFEIVDVLEVLEPAERTVVFRLLGKDDALKVFEEMDVDLQGALMEGFAETRAVEYLEDLPTDERVRLLDELPAKVARRFLDALPPEIRRDTDSIMGYEAETAGRLMNPSFVSVRESGTVADALERIRGRIDEVEYPYVVFVTDSTRRLKGVLSLRELVSGDPDAGIAQIMNPEVVSAGTDEDQEIVAKVLQERELPVLPVTDTEGRLVGIVSIHDAMDVLEEEVTEDIFEKAGLLRLQEREAGRSRRLLEGSLWQVWRVRLPFLCITLIGGMLAGAVIAGFEDILESVALVAFFIPVIMDMGGNVGTQSSTIFARALVLGHIDVNRFLDHWLKELGNGASMGAVLGIVGGVVAAAWQGIPELGWAVGISLFATITIATGLGFLIPWLLSKAGVDQAAGADPIITTLKDMTGLVIYFVSVTLLMGHLL